MFMCVLGRYVVSTVLIISTQTFGGGGGGGGATRVGGQLCGDKE